MRFTNFCQSLFSKLIPVLTLGLTLKIIFEITICWNLFFFFPQKYFLFLWFFFHRILKTLFFEEKRGLLERSFFFGWQAHKDLKIDKISLVIFKKQPVPQRQVWEIIYKQITFCFNFKNTTLSLRCTWIKTIDGMDWPKKLTQRSVWSLTKAILKDPRLIIQKSWAMTKSISKGSRKLTQGV